MVNAATAGPDAASASTTGSRVAADMTATAPWVGPAGREFREPTLKSGVCGEGQEAAMGIFGARADDWHSDNAYVKPAVWIAAFVCAVAFYFAVAAIVGHIVNGNGSPFLR